MGGAQFRCSEGHTAISQAIEIVKLKPHIHEALSLAPETKNDQKNPNPRPQTLRNKRLHLQALETEDGMREARFRAVDSLISEHPTLRDAAKNGSTASVQAHLDIGDHAYKHSNLIFESFFL
jgi:hypothetical protein